METTSLDDEITAPRERRAPQRPMFAPMSRDSWPDLTPTPRPIARSGSFAHSQPDLVELAQRRRSRWTTFGVAGLGLAVGVGVIVGRGGSSNDLAIPVQPAPAATVVPPPAPASLPGRINVSTRPADASVWLDGALVGVTPLSMPAMTGTHQLVIAREGMKLVERRIELAATDASVQETLEPAKLPEELEGKGGLKVRCRTIGELRIRVDGHDTGLTCPNDDRIAVAPGGHRIGLYSPRTGEVNEVEGTIDPRTKHSTRIYVKY